jgi:hypothetical protein
MNKFTWMLLALVAIASFNCGVRRSSVPTELQARATATVPFSFVMDLECTEMAASFPIDATLARQLVPPEYEVDLEADGKARGALVVQNCSKLVLEGEDLGPTPFAHQWIKIKGPYEMDPIPGAEKTFPTFYWYVLEDQTTNHKLIAAGKRAGMNYTKIESLSLSPTQGEVVEKQFEKKRRDIHGRMRGAQFPKRRLECIIDSTIMQRIS